MRLMYMPDDKDVYLDQIYLTNACESDQNNLDVLIDDKTCTHVFDRGYVNYEHFDRMT
ncbi:hypothetical protein [Staphylococcus americanisciuri]|uniref:Transposase n=1 Tax=Staphylococcus americanisciuri TaxID=2973940 RepID=A0ABT2F0T7_9STAP|nr:hypothetical protein [Staphylococcus americanisciuri]MCS4485758.1 hypothetical protein [Staphylococcus americanisciuri]